MDASASTGQAPTAISSSDIREAWDAANVSPLWENRAAHNNSDRIEPACIWRWSVMEPLITAALAERSMAAVERRVLSLVSPHTPAVGGTAGTTLNLNAGLQILKPGESARPHRHSMNALRFVLSGNGATTVVDGKVCEMAEGDLVTTPGWCWHEHIHKGNEPIVWLDVLDASLHRYLGTDAFQPGPANDMPRLTPDAAFTSACLVPETREEPASYSPVFRYPWREAAAAVSIAPVGRDGTRRVRYANPRNGGPIMAFLDCWLIEIPAGGETVGFRTSANAVFAVVEGTGTSEVGKETFSWGPRDIASMPHGNWIKHRANGGRARLFVVSDREVLRRLDLLTEDYAEGG